MVGKVQLVSGLADWTAHSITQDADSWKRYLATASRLYKYSFDDQLLIYAQRPGAKACASMELWNDRMHRWVKRGSKGIALLRQREGGRPYLTYVFEVSDTRPVQGAREPNLWRMGEEHWPAVLETLERQYGASGSQELGKRLMEAVEHAVEEVCPEYLRDLAYDRGNRERNPGEGRGGRETAEHFREVLCASVQYTVLTRCGLNAEDYLEPDSLSGIQAFSDPGALHHLGNAVSAVSMGILQEIGRTIRRQDRETAEKLQKNRQEKEERQKEEKTLENNVPIRYTENIEEFNTLKRESREGSGEHGESDIQEMRGIPDPGTGSGRGGWDGRDAHGEIRNAEAEISAGAPQGDIHLHAADGQTHGAPEGHRQAGTGAGGSDGGGDDGAGRSGRNPERAGSDGLGAGGERLYGTGGGSGTAGNRVQLGKEEADAAGEPVKLSGEQFPGAGRESIPEKEQTTETEKYHREERETAGQNPAVSASMDRPEQDSAVSTSPGQPGQDSAASTSPDQSRQDSAVSMSPGQPGQEPAVFLSPDQPEQESALSLHEQDATAGMPEIEESPEAESAQLSLFPTVEGQMERIARAQEMQKTERISAAARTGVPGDVIDMALTCGNNDKKSILRIIACYQKSTKDAEAAAFLRKEYGTGGMGIRAGGKEYAFWYDEEGIRIAPGRSARVPGSTLVPWEEAARRIRRLLKDGKYALQEKLDAAWRNDHTDLAAVLWYMEQDTSIAAKDRGFLPILSALYGGFPESSEKIADALMDKERKAAIVAEIQEFRDACEQDRGLIRGRLYEPGKVLQRIALAGLDAEPLQFRAAEGFEPARGSFLTEDEIDDALKNSDSLRESILHLVSYFKQGHSSGECVALLKKERRGRLLWHGGCRIRYGSRGAEITRQDEVSGSDGYDTATLDWKTVEKRIRGMIQRGTYLNREETAFIPEYEKQELARQIYDFHYRAPVRSGKEKREWDPEAAKRDYLPILKDAKYTKILYEDMAETLAAVPREDTENYLPMKKIFKMMEAYVQGKYSLFTPLSGDVLRKQRMEREAEKRKKREMVADKSPEEKKAEAHHSTGQKENQGKEAGDRAARPEKTELQGELEAAARILVRKERQKITEGRDGQLSFDFGAFDMAEEQEDFPAARELEPISDKVSDAGIKTALEAEPEPEKAMQESEARAAEESKNPEIVTGELRAEKAAGQPGPVSDNASDTGIKTALEAEPEKTKQESGARTTEESKNLETATEAMRTEVDAVGTEPVSDIVPDVGIKPKPEVVRKQSPVTLYRETLAELTELIRHGSLMPYLRDRDTSYEEAAEELDNELEYFLEEIQDSRPELYEAFRSLPRFREWMVEDILERTYQDVAMDGRDAAARHMGEADAPEWLREPELPEGDGRILNEVESRELEEAKQLIDGFCWNEYGAEPMEFDDLEHTVLAWDVIEDEKHAVTILTEADLVDFSLSKLVDGICVEKRQYGSLRELIDKELYSLDYVELVRLDGADPEKLVELGIPEEQLQEMMGNTGQQREPHQKEQGATEQKRELPHVEWEIIGRGRMGIPETAGLLKPEPEEKPAEQAGAGEKAAFPELVEIEGSQIVTAESVEIEGGQVITTEPGEIYHTGLPYDIVTQKLHISHEFQPGQESRPGQGFPSGSEAHNFRITDEALGAGGQKTKFQNNLAAIRTLKQIEAENRMAAPEEQEILSKYVGWGGLAQAFDPSNERWAKEYTQLKDALTPEEYESARGSVLNAHYTSPIVIGAVYEALECMGLAPGNILEPSCGTGNFFGLLPEEYQNASLYGVELDSLTGRIAGQLYQKAHITVDGFEHTEYPDDFFDLAIGNVPFGEYKVHDRRYDRHNLLIHDYFLTKALDKVRPGGIMAFLTSKGTMDKVNSSVREGLAQKADLLGAIRLPNNAFMGNAGTIVTADILFFQKRGSTPEKLPDWVHTGKTAEDIPMNRYFLQHPEMVLGRMAFAANMYGNERETACLPFEGADLKELLARAVGGIALPDRELLQMDAPEQEGEEDPESIPADPDVRNFSFTEKKGKFYFRENSRMKRVHLKGLPAERARGMISIRDSARRLISLQLDGAGDGEIEKEQAALNVLYDGFQKKYGLLNSPGNRQVFRQDSSYPLLSSLEVLDGEGNFKCKADMFSKRTINYRSPVGSVDTAVEALGVSIGERACVDLGFMASLMGGSEKIPQIVDDLKGIIFKDPATGPFDPGMQGEGWLKGWQAADEYLSGNVRRKLTEAGNAAVKYPEFAVNVEALEKVQPKDLSAPEISVRIGVPWIDTKYYRQFLVGLLKPSAKLEGKIRVLYSESTGEWRVEKGGAAANHADTRVWNTYGTKRINAYEIFEDTLNQRAIQIFDYKELADGREVRVLNGKETAIAQQKQDAMKQAFQDWIFKEPARRADLCGTYNRLFNSTRPREYDGRHIIFSGMNPEKRLEPHQRNAVARILYGGNTLLAHVVGAGKTYEMAAAAMEGRRLGLCRKSMMVVPNHLTEQWGSEFLSLYPGAKVLVATKKDFEPKNRKRFCARIATGDFDAVIIGHSQFEKIPLSTERQEAIIREQMDEVMDGITEAKAEKQERFTIKQMERTKKNLEEKLQKLYDKKKDDTVTFEELGIDRLFVDEAHYYKNLFLQTKMRNIAGISQSDAQKSSDMFAKCRYLDEITGGKGIIFATGTPISNSVVELYTMMRYLQYGMLEQGLKDSTGQTRSLLHFDNWAATFGEQVTAVELKPEGTGFRLKTRFSRFYNLPELMNLWKEAADIQTAEMLNLPVPEAEYVTIQTEPSASQKEMVKGLAERAEKIRNEKLDPAIDNMLKVTSDGRKLALDQRIMNPLLPDDPGSKVNACVENVFRIWQETADKRGAQLIFSDLSTPKGKAAAKKDSPEQDTEDRGEGRKESRPRGKEDRSTDQEKMRPYGNAAVGRNTEGTAEEDREESALQDGAAVAAGTSMTGESNSAGDAAVAEGEASDLSAAEDRMEASVYEDIRKKLIARGVPAEEVAFIHSANTETQKAELFAKVRDGRVRILLGSTQKMGAGTNVQTRLVASHDLDCPWRPADLEQRAGRIIRRGNENRHVRIYRYVTKGTFDAYTWGLVESKQKFIGQVMTGKSPVRSMEDVDATALSYAEVKMLATGDVRIKEKMDLDIQVTKLKMLKSNHLSQQYELQDRVRGYYPDKMKEAQLYIDCLEADLPILEAHPAKEDAFAMTVMETAYTDRKEAGKAIVAACRLIDEPGKEAELGEYRGFPMKLSFSAAKFKVTMKQHLTYTAELSDDIVGNIARINNALERIPQSLEAHREELVRLQGEMENAKQEIEKPFLQEQELAEKSARLAELNAVLDHEEKGGEEPEKDKGTIKKQGKTEKDNAEKEKPGKEEARGNGKDCLGKEPGGRPSILKALKEYEPPAPVKPGMGRKAEREVAG